MIGKALHYMRKQKKFNQEQVANNVGIARNTVSQYETEKIQPTFETIEKIANFCDFSIIFRDNKTKEEFTVKSVKRKDV